MAQGIVTGIRGLCNGLGPALYGFIFYLFHVDLNQDPDDLASQPNQSDPQPTKTFLHSLHEVSRRHPPPPPLRLAALVGKAAIDP